MFAAMIASVSIASASSGPEGMDQVASIKQMLRTELARKYPGARIELGSGFRLIQGSLSQTVASLTVLADNGRGEAQFTIRGGGDDPQLAEGVADFAAWVPSYVANRRVLPGEKLVPELFSIQDVNVASGQAHDYRGVIFQREQKIDGLQSRQTVLEGQFLTSTAVERIPDIRRGDTVRIEMNSGGLVLTTQGIAEEPAYTDGQVRVMTAKTKRELTGKLISGGVVQVSL